MGPLHHQSQRVRLVAISTETTVNTICMMLADDESLSQRQIALVGISQTTVKNIILSLFFPAISVWVYAYTFTRNIHTGVLFALRRCHEQTSYVSNFALSFYRMNGSIEGRCINIKNSSVCNSDFIARSVILEFFKVTYLPSIDPFMH